MSKKDHLDDDFVMVEEGELIDGRFEFVPNTPEGPNVTKEDAAPGYDEEGDVSARMNQDNSIFGLDCSCPDCDLARAKVDPELGSGPGSLYDDDRDLWCNKKVPGIKPGRKGPGELTHSRKHRSREARGRRREAKGMARAAVAAIK